MDTGDLRREYRSTGLDEDQLKEDPFEMFELWFSQAVAAKVQDPTAFSLATTGSDMMPSVRTVLMKTFDKQGFVFYTNFGSQKAKEIEQNAKVSMLFPWLALDRQIRVQGEAVRVSTAESLKYFSTRPRGSQLGAWCSAQSEVISSRQFLEMKLDEMKRRFQQGDVPLPSFWGGYRIVPTTLEFWQGRENRLHDRFQYRLIDQQWQVSRLAP